MNCCSLAACLLGSVAFLVVGLQAEELKNIESRRPFTDFTNFESAHIHPMDLSPDGRLLAVCNTANAAIHFFDITEPEPAMAFTVPVGLDPVSVRFRSATEAWAVAHLSDNVSVIDVPSGTVTQTLETGDEPCDVVFAGAPEKAYVSVSQENRLEIFSLDPLDPEPRVLPLKGEEPRALAVSPDGQDVHVAFFETGNGTTILAGGIRNKDMLAFPPDMVSHEESPYGGENPAPSSYKATYPVREAINRSTAPETGFIVKQREDGVWMDENGADWTTFVSGERAAMSGRVPGWKLLDHEVATISTSDESIRYRGGTMNLCMGLAVHPLSGIPTLVGTDALNHIRYQPVLNGVFLRVKIGLLDTTHDLNPHLDYQSPRVPQAMRELSLGDPRAILWSVDGTRGYITGKGSNNLIVIDAQGKRLEESSPVRLGEGPTGMALSPEGNRLFVLNRFGASVSVVDTLTMRERSRTRFPDSTPEVVKRGRRHLFDTHHSSGLGHVSCGSCHVDGRMDRLAWDLGVPDGKKLEVTKRSMPIGGETPRTQHPMKGPMITQTFQDIIGKGPFHWRGDTATFEEFNPTYTDLLGREEVLSDDEMVEFKEYLRTLHFPPNPFRNEDNSLPSALPLPDMVTAGRFGEAGEPLPNGDAKRGLTLFQQRPHPKMNNLTCFGCHIQTSGIGGGQPMDGGEMAHAITGLTGAGQGPFKVAQLRNLYDKQGLSLSRQESLHGFGYFHDGSVDTLPQFLTQPMFDVQSVEEVADLTAFLLSFSGNDSSNSERSSWSSQTPSVETHTLTGKQETYRSDEFPAGSNAMMDRMTSVMRFAEDEGTISIIAHGRIDGEARHWIMRETDFVQTHGSPPGRTIKLLPPEGNSLTDTTYFDSDQMNVSYKLKDLLKRVDGLTFTVVPQGRDAFRLSIDHDGDGLFNRDEIRDLDPQREGHQNPFDPKRADATGNAYSLVPDGVLDALNDFDNDGTANLVEMDEGTNPVEGWTGGTDHMRVGLSATRASSQPHRISWNGRPGYHYHLESSTDLSAWKAVNEEPLTGGVREDRLHHLLPDRETRYYRVRETKDE